MKVSIIVPIYGVEKYIEQCAESLFLQDYPYIEYIFVDDCTPDDSINILEDTLKRFPERQPSVKVLYHATNRGLGASRLTGLREATGDAIMHVDSDDLLPLDAVSKLANEMQRMDADIVEGGHSTCNNGIISINPVRRLPSKKRYIKRILCQDITPFNVWAKLYKRSLFFENNVFFVEGIDYGEDLSIVPRLIYCSQRISRISDTVYIYRIDNSHSYTHEISKKNIYSCIQANNTIYSFFKDKQEYANALSIGMINNYRNARTRHLDFEYLEQELLFSPRTHFERLLVNLFLCKSFSFALSNFLYKSVRFIIAYIL